MTTVPTTWERDVVVRAIELASPESVQIAVSQLSALEAFDRVLQPDYRAVSFRVPDGVPSFPTELPGPIALSGVDGGGARLELLLFLKRGRLTGLEYYVLGEDRLSALPRPELLEREDKIFD